jgi:hypothetical protein
MFEIRNYVKYPKLGNPVLNETRHENGELKLSDAMETHDTHDIHDMMYISK